MTCKQSTCNHEATHEMAYQIQAAKDGKTEILTIIAGPFCQQCINGMVEALKDGMPHKLFEHITAPIVANGYTVMPDYALCYRPQPVGAMAAELEYIPKPGKCHQENCNEDATVKPVLVIPTIQGTAYAEGDGYCTTHGKLRTLSRISPEDIRATLFKLSQSGSSPIQSQMRVELVLIEWQPPNASVIITPDMSDLVDSAKRRASRAHNN